MLTRAPDFLDTHANAARITRRRVAMLSFVFFISGIASLLMGDLLWGMPLARWGWLMWAVFTALFALVSLGAAHAVFGFLARRGGGDSCAIGRSLPPGEEYSAPLAPTAIVMPVYNEDARRVFAGLRAIYRSVARTGRLEHFDFLVLSDTTEPERWLEEETAWVDLTRELGARSRLFYRRRRTNSHKKAGNIADFCRRWGRRYRYMVVLDADSVMAGATLVRLVQLMERNPHVGLIQTAPTLVRAETLFARALQFAFRLYGPIFQAGLNYWQQGEGNYWGHNAILRLAPFMQHCALPALPGREPFGGAILSHDFVEAALLRRAGWAVWLAPELDGSHEETPPTLIDFAKRDRRWAQGNLQHFWLLFAREIPAMSRVHFALGILAYSASLFWLVSLALGTLLMIGFSGTGLSWLPQPGFAAALGLTAGAQAAVLTIYTFFWLFLPKGLAWLDLALQPHGLRRYGGGRKLAAGMLIETTLSILLAPVLMLFHAKFVVSILLGSGVRWAEQRRSADGAVGWREATRTHAGHTAVGLMWTAATAWWTPSLLPWLSPLLLGMVFSIPLSRLTGLVSPGARARARGWLCTPEEIEPTAELEEIEDSLRGAAALAAAEAQEDALLLCLIDPYRQAVHRCMQPDRPRQPHATRERLVLLSERLLREGPAALNAAERMALLSDALSLDWLHRELWRRELRELAPAWKRALRTYTDSLPAAA
jgi:membrane glycosyltransferase